MLLHREQYAAAIGFTFLCSSSRATLRLLISVWGTVIALGNFQHFYLPLGQAGNKAFLPCYLPERSDHQVQPLESSRSSVWAATWGVCSWGLAAASWKFLPYFAPFFSSFAISIEIRKDCCQTLIWLDFFFFFWLGLAFCLFYIYSNSSHLLCSHCWQFHLLVFTGFRFGRSLSGVQLQLFGSYWVCWKQLLNSMMVPLLPSET